MSILENPGIRQERDALPLFGTVFFAGRFSAFPQRDRLLFGCDFDGLTEQGLNFGLINTHTREKHPAEPMQFGTTSAMLKPFSQRFRLVYCLKGFRGAIREM